MARLTKLRAKQTRAGDKYAPSEENLATDAEVEARVRKHSQIFHGVRDDNTVFSFDADGILNAIDSYKPGNTEKLKHSEFSFDSDGSLTGIYIEIYDINLNSYVKKQKDISYDSDGIITGISNTIL